MNINPISPSFKGNIRFVKNSSVLDSKEDASVETEDTFEIPAENIVSYRELRQVRLYRDGAKTGKITSQITDIAGHKYNFNMPLYKVKEKIEAAKQSPDATVEIPNVDGMA